VSEIELIERGEDLAREAQQVRPVGTALQDLQAIGARAMFLASRSTSDQATAAVIAEAVRSAYARGIRNAMAAGFLAPHHGRAA
jgi:hypothetical protein